MAETKARRRKRRYRKHGLPAPDSAAGRLRAALADSGVTVEQLADRLGVAPGTVYGVHSGFRSPTLEWLHRAAGAIPCDPSRLDPRLGAAAGGSVSLARSGESWSGLGEADREQIRRLGFPGPVAAGDLGALAEEARQVGLAVVIRSDLPPGD